MSRHIDIGEDMTTPKFRLEPGPECGATVKIAVTQERIEHALSALPRPPVDNYWMNHRDSQQRRTCSQADPR
jgi:hypothetical protein